MKITLEKEDLATMLSKAMGYDISVEDMEVRTDPFEVVIQNVRKSELAEATVSENAPAQEPIDSAPFTNVAPEMPEEHAQKAITELRNINAQITQSGGGAGPVPPSEQPMFRDPSVLGPNESYSPDFED